MVNFPFFIGANEELKPDERIDVTVRFRVLQLEFERRLRLVVRTID